MIADKHKIARYCNEDISNIENYETAITSDLLYDCHHRLELEDENGVKRDNPISAKDLIKNGLYYHRPANELIFIEHREHTRLHHKGKHISEETKRKISENSKNMSEETKQKISEANKGRQFSEESRRKMSEKARNRSQETRDKLSKAQLGKHHSDETKRKLSESHKNPSKETRIKMGIDKKGKHWSLDENEKRYWHD